jgi:FAD/FMN-containing dehydrogenase
MRPILSLLPLASIVLGLSPVPREDSATTENRLYQCVAKVFSTTASQRIVRPSNATYLDARLGETIQEKEFPLLIAYAEKASEVPKLVKCAQAAGIKAVPRSGGHSFTSFSALTGTLVIDVGHINYVDVSKDRRSAVVGGGIRLGALYTALNEYNTSFIGGICPTVGLAGYLGSGGFNMQQRTQGMAVDHVLAAKVVTADGRIVRASPKCHSDLFWAILGGGGGTFGIAVEFTLSLTQIPRSAMLSMTWKDNESRFPVAKRFMDWAPKQEQSFMSQINIYHDTVQIVAWHYGESAAALQKLVDSSGLLSFGTPEVIVAGGCGTNNARLFGYTIMDCVADKEVDASILNVIPDPFSQVGNNPQFQYKEERKSDTVGPAPPWERFRRMSKSFFTQKDKPLQDDILQGLLDRIAQLDEHSEVWGEWHAWNISDTAPRGSNAFAWRDKAYAHLEFQVHGSTDETQQKVYEDWFAELESYLRPAVGAASYSGYTDNDISTEPLTSYYGDSVCKLIQVKKAYDPKEFFTNPFSIPASPPAGVQC